MVETSGPARPMPLIVFHSLDDPWVPYRGSSRLYAWFAHLAAAYPAVEETIARWRAFDRCPAKARAGPVLKGAAGTRDAGNSATRYAWGIMCLRHRDRALETHRFGPRVAGRRA